MDHGEHRNRNRYAIIGLGNPGERYQQTRHNLGFMVIDAIFRALNPLSSDLAPPVNKHQSQYWTVPRGEGTLILAKPQTFMNKSGIAVRELLQFYKLSPKNMLIIYDDHSLNFGTIKIRPTGRSGGHNGIASVMQHIGNAVLRLKCGIAPFPPSDENETDGQRILPHPVSLRPYVLGNFLPAEKKQLPAYCECLACVALSCFYKDLDVTINHSNGKHFTEINRKYLFC